MPTSALTRGLGAAAILLLAAGPVPAADVVRREFSAPPGTRLELDTDRGAVTVAGTNAGVVIVEVERRLRRATGEVAEKLLAAHEVTFTEDGGVIRMKARRTGKPASRRGRPDLEVEVRAWVPARFNVAAHTSGGRVAVRDVAGEVSATTSGGGIELEGVTGRVAGETSGGGIRGRRLGGDVVLNTSGGSISVDEFSGTKLMVKTSGGSISLTEVTGAVEARTSGGGIEIKAAAGPIEARTSGGSVHASLREPPAGPVSLATSGGGVTIELPADAAFEVDAGTSAGGVNSDFPVTLSGSPGNRSASGKINGGGPLVALKSSAGSISLRKH